MFPTRATMAADNSCARAVKVLETGVEEAAGEGVDRRSMDDSFE